MLKQDAVNVRCQEETPNRSLLEFTKTYLNNLILETKGAVGKRLPKTPNAGGLKTEDEMRWKTVGDNDRTKETL